MGENLRQQPERYRNTDTSDSRPALSERGSTPLQTPTAKDSLERPSSFFPFFLFFLFFCRLGPLPVRGNKNRSAHGRTLYHYRSRTRTSVRKKQNLEPVDTCSKYEKATSPIAHERKRIKQIILDHSYTPNRSRRTALVLSTKSRQRLRTTESRHPAGYHI